MQEEILEGYRLAPQQRHLWEALRYGRNGAYQTKCAVAIKGRLESRHLRTAAEKIVARHEILRTSFQCLPGMTIPMQVINETGVVVWREADLSGLDERAWLIEYFFAGDLQPFDFEQGPFLLLHLIKKADDDYALLVRLPAICADLVSIRNLVGELCQEYEAAARGEELDRDVIQYADLAEWQNDLIEAEEMQAARDHWRRRALPHPSTLQLAFESAPAGDWSFEPHLSELVITPYLAALIESSAQSLRTSVEQVLLCCWYILLWRHTGQSEIEVGIAFDGRRAEEVEDALGLFAKYLPITCHLEEGLRFGELIELINKSLETARNWQEYFSWEQLVDSSGAELRPSFTPFCFETETPLQTFLAGDVSFAIFRQFACLNRFKIKLSYAHRPDGLVVTFHYDSQLFRSEDIRSLIGQYQTLLENGAARLVAKIGQLEIVGEAERRQLLFGYNSTKVEWPEGKTVHELFVAQQERTPEAIAAIYEDQQLTYRELNERAARLARYLLGLGVGPEVIVGICMERSLDMIVSLLAILKAGGSYLPLDPSYPLARLSLMLEDAAVTVLLTQTRLRSRFSPAESLRIECVDALWEELSQAPARDCETMLSPDNLAYVIYTSGATGRPKGVMLRHGSLTNYLLWAINHYPVGVGFGAPVHSSLSFDLTITALFPPLLVGGHIHLLPTENEIEALTAAFSRRSGYSLVKLTPAHLQLLAEQLGEIDLNGAARSLVIGGENLSAQAVSWWSERAPAIRLFNEYGPTESVVGCSVYEVGSKLEVEKGRAVVPIGKPIANTRLYLLDERQQLTSYGAVGELYIAGDGLARGYLNQPDLTAERFVPEPYSGEPGTRRYHTGDLARYLRDGHLDCIGRVDDQVKIRGYRIELGEIEAVLRTLPGVREAVAIATSEDGQNRLIGYVVGDGDWRPDIAQSRRCLREHLPEYMVPAALITLDALPLTANGKIDRKRLSAMPLESLQKHSGWQSGSGDETRTPTEEIVAGIFKEVLRLDQVGKRDNFFQIGGHSLLATQVASRVRGTFGVEIGVKGVFKDATVEGLATQIEAAMNRGEKAVGPLLVRAPRDSQGDWRPPLSFAQQRLWFIDQLEPGNPVYNIPGAVILEGPLNLQAFERAINEIVRRHEALRTRFEVEAGKPAQVIDAWEPRSLEVEDLTAVPAEERAREIRLKARDEARRSFDLRRGPLMRIKALKLEEEKHVTLFTMHHIVSDAWSMGVLVRELGELYKAFSEGQASPLPELEIQYADYAVWQREYLTGEALESEIGYWKAQLQGAAVMDLPTDRIRPATPSHRGSKEKVRIDREIRDGLRKLSQREGATLFMVLMAAFKTLLMRYSGEEDLSVGTAIANRTRRETEGLIGFFVNTLVMRTNLGGNPCFKELIEREREVALGAYARQEAPFEKLVEEINPERDLSRSPLFQVMMVLQNAKQEDLDLRGLKISGIGGETEVAKFDLTLILIEGETGISGYLEYSRDLYDSETVMRMVEHFEHVVKEVVEDSERRIQEIELLSESEKRQIVEEWNATEAPYGKERLIHELFEEQAATTSDAVAVAHEDCHLSYNDLNVRANRLARYLRTLNARPDARVALCLERGPDMIVSLLAILKAGGAYVPLDPAYPTERLGYMLEDSAPVAILTHNHVASQAQATILATSAVAGVPVIDLQADAARWASEPDTDPDPEGVGLTPEHLAYVIYTSGSTGLPKGVAIEHRNTVNLIRWAQRAFAGDVLEKTLFSTSLNFDLAVYECFVPLTVGGGVRIVSDALELARQAVDVTLINTVPSAMKALVEGNKIPPTVRMVNLAGDQLKRELVERIFETTDTEEVRNLYGPSETTTYSTWVAMRRGEPFAAHIGRPIANTRVYILDGGREPAPAGVIGEIHIGGAGVARGYLNRVDLTAERFVQDPFSQEAGARMYRTGDLGRWLADGTIEFLGRNDFQVKLRGFRIELGEIEARLASHPAIKEAVALAREDSPGDKRLVAYYTTADAVTPGPDAEALRGYLLESLPEYMAPAAYVKLDALPLTPNGKLDRRALPTPEDKAYVRRGYEPPVGGTEIKLAGIWADLLKLERVGRQDNFFELGGHSLLAISMIERMRRDGLPTEVRTLFAAPTLRALAEAIEGASPAEVKVPPNLIPAGCGRITPEMLPLVELTQPEIDTIVAGAPGGAPNVQDIYPLAPLQEGILFHHLMNARGDAYLLHSLLAFDTRERLDSVLSALRQVIARHDILRTALVWEGLPEPVQVVWREALLTVEEITLDPSEGEVADQLLARFDPRRIRLDLSQAPLMRCIVTTDAVRGRWLLLWLSHHLTTDHMALEVMIREAQAALLGEIDRLPAPLPFRNLVAQARMRRERREDEEFFREMLGSVEEPTAPYGLLEVQGDGSEVEQARVDLDATLARRLKERAREMGVSAASVCHVAWGRVVGRVTGREDVVFGTVLFGRMGGGGEGAERVLGLFINTLPIRVGVGRESVERSVRRTQEALGGLMSHEHASLAVAQRCSGVKAPAPLFSCLLNYRHSQREVKRSRVGREAWVGMEALESGERTNYPLTLSVDDLGDGFGLTAQAIRPIDAGRICEYMRKALEGLVEALERAPETEVRWIEVVPEGERRQILEEWNETEAEYPRERCVHELFEEQVERSPEAVALVYEDRQLSYGELNARANRLARHLRSLGVGPECRVAICLERSVELVVGLLGVLKAGGAYVPLDPSYPPNRLTYMVKDCAPAILLTHEATSALTVELASGLLSLNLDSDAAEWGGQFDNKLSHAGTEPAPENPAYVIYTSGSTGQPKGVMVNHYGVVNLLCSMRGVVNAASTDCVPVLTTIGFDIAGLEIYLPLICGARAILVDQAKSHDPKALAEAMAVSGATLVQATPAAWRMLLDSGWPGKSGLKVLCGGEALPIELAGAVRERVGALWNVYGPTETTIWSSAAQVGATRSTCIVEPIGRPIANTQIYILDERYEPSPIKVAGEIYIGGAGVARGYLKRPDLTAERFLPDPYTQQPGASFYRTGDLGRWLPEGDIEFLGRNDFQVKIRGFRIELGEIEARLAAHDGVREAVVAPREEGEVGKMLVAYYTGAEVGAEALRVHLSSSLPEYMVPAAYVHLERLPLTPNGKLDRRALPAPDVKRAEERDGYLGPRTPVEEIVVGIFEEVLKLDRVGRRENFFELGGHSLSAAQVVSRIRKMSGVEIGVRSVFEEGTVEGLARKIEEAMRAGEKVETPPLAPVERESERGRRAPLSFAQQRLWFTEQLEPGNTLYNIPGGVRLEGSLNVEALEGAINEIVRRHEVLRTRIEVEEGEPFQVIDEWEPRRLEVENLSGMAVEERAREVKKAVKEEAGKGFDLSREPLMRVKLLKLEEEEHVALFTMHHIISDAWSMGVLVRELCLFYEARSKGLESPLPELDIQYADYASWQRNYLSGEALEEHLRYWRKQLGVKPQAVNLAGDHPRPSVPSDRGAVKSLSLPADLYGSMKSLSKREGATMFMVLLAAFKTLLHKYTAQDDILVGTSALNRNRMEIEPLIGFFVNMLPMKTNFGGNPRFREILRRVKMVALGAYTHQDLPFEKLVEEIQPERKLGQMPLFNIVFGVFNAPQEEMRLSGLKVSSVAGEDESARLDLSLWITEGAGTVRAVWTYSTDLFEEETIVRMHRHFETLLSIVVAQPDVPLDQIEILSEAERIQQSASRIAREEYNYSRFKNVKPRAVALSED